MASNLVAYLLPGGDTPSLLPTCDANGCLEAARKVAACDDRATITRVRNSAALFYKPKPSGPPDHEPPYVCAACRAHKHQHCPDQVPIRKDGKLVIVQCDCLMNQHALDPAAKL